jgi:branched-chain amino acid transport system permease protein
LTQIFVNILISTSIFLLVAASFSLTYYPTKYFHLAHGAIITCGAYFVFLFVNRFSVPLLFTIGLAIGLATLLGTLCEVLVYRRMRKKKAPAFAYLIASIGLYVLLQNCISLYFGDDTKNINTGQVKTGHQIFGAYITTIQIVTVFVCIFLIVVTNLFIRFFSAGKAIRAVSGSSELSAIYGINSNKIILIAFSIGSALAASAGILSALDTNMTPTFGFNLLLYSIVAMIIGGVGSYRGLILGSLLLATAQNLAAWYLDSKWMDAMAYIILILFLIWKPLGFSGQRLKKVEV